jgi:hypothetical protein
MWKKYPSTPRVSLGKTLKLYQGLKPAPVPLSLQVSQLGKTLKPYQGLKQFGILQAVVELRWKTLKPYQGLKFEVLSKNSNNLM